MEEEFEALWQESFPLPEAIIEEIKRVAERVEMRFEEVTPAELPAAALAESPIYRGGEQLQPWQRAFVAMFLKHRETYGKTRLLLADEVGLGGIRLTRDSWVSVMYAEALNSAKSSVTLQSTDRHGILGQKSADFQVSL